MGFIDIATNLGTTLVSSTTDALLINDHTQSIDGFKNRLGMGFRPNQYRTTFLFPDANTSDFYTKITKESVLFVPPSYLAGIGFGVSALVSSAVSAIQSAIQAASFSVLSEQPVTYKEFPLLSTSFQMPGSTLDMTGDISKKVKYAKGNTPGVCSFEVINDQWNTNYNFCRNYINNISDGKAVYYYPNEYKFNIIVDVYSHSWKVYQTYKLIGCTMTDVTEQKFDKGPVSDIPKFTVTVDYEDYESSITKPLFITLGPLGSFYAAGVADVLGLNAVYAVLNVLSRANNGAQSTDLNVTQTLSNYTSLVTIAQSIIKDPTLTNAANIKAVKDAFSTLIPNVGIPVPQVIDIATDTYRTLVSDSISNLPNERKEIINSELNRIKTLINPES